MPFQIIANQPKVVAALKGALERDRLPHALLFQGPANSGQRETAAELAKVCFCENKKELEPCGSCYHCRQIDQNTHPDFCVLELDDDARELKVEEIRNIIAKANYKPFSASAKIFVIDQADRMNEIAQNAFLKSLEEPLGRTVFVLISSSPQQLLATIRSRVQTLHFGQVPQNQAPDPKRDQLKKNVLEYVLYNANEPLKAPDLSKLSREELSDLFDGLIEYHRDLLLIHAGAAEIVAQNESLFEKEKFAKKFGEDELEDRIELFSEMKEKIGENLNVRLVLSFLWETLASAVSVKTQS